MNPPQLPLPEAQAHALKRAIRIEWATIAFLAVAITMVYLVMGNSQAMKAAWIEDLLSLAPPLAFLLAVRLMAKPPTETYPYGFFRSVGVAHLVAGVALFAMGAFLLVESVIGLARGDRPPIGSVELFGQTVWLGWLMMVAMALTIPLPIYFGRVKMQLAEQLHNKVLYADADMNKADWMTAVGSIVGVAGIGIGLWWADAVTATLIATSILWDGVKNTRAAITDLMDTRATTFDDYSPHPDAALVDEVLAHLPWVAQVATRVRDQGQFFHVEAFIVPTRGRMPTLEQVTEATEECTALDWKIHDMVITLVPELPAQLAVTSPV
ncbi:MULTISPECIES: cation diffusion facilitator family transporter [unclassified Microbacterium]|uniref:cation diffusion facilitator family transporter n=1 Tax=unclassified Microbacterium TaxID=2609290 RepID=UPI00214BAA66|nr:MULTISPECIES: cation diffusion facilitator family transporter [unclassified Microbacterium]MCR2783549.1 cation diffusion facilitator family transporter [Microbacterium sp. zg.B96]WIM15590.1 cation diffusion facilitator family transporter [Microbacterium sp. zg-B96]